MKQEQQSSASLLRLVALLVVAAFVAGCGGAPAPTASAPTTAASAPTAAPAATQAPAAALAPTEIPAPTTQPAASPAPAALTYAFPDDQVSSAAATAQIKAYASAHPQVQVTAKPLPAAEYPKQLLATIDTGLADLFVSTDAQAPALIKRKAVLDLQSLLAGQAALKPDQFQPAALAPWQRDGALYGLPIDAVPQVLFYNQDLFEANGVASPAAGWTWDDWLASAKKLTVSSGGQVTRYGTAVGPWSAMVWGNGGDLLSADGAQTLLDSPEAVAGVQFAADLVNVHKVAPPPKDAGGPEPVQLFENQQVAMMPGPSSLAGDLLAAKLPFKWAIAPLPVGKQPVSPLSVSGLAISSHSQNQQAALDFATFIVGPQGSAIKANLLPFAAPTLLSTPAHAANVTGEEAILQALQHGRTLPQVEQWPQIKTLVDDALKPVWQGKMKVSAAYARVVPQINALLKTG
jgi:ABC-type glycerol-3-phosphate transport system substrate-binding protein